VASVSIPLEDAADALAALRELLSTIGYRGAFNAEFKRDPADGQAKLLEVNARPAWYVGTIAGAGVDIPWMLYLDAQGFDVPDATDYRVGRHEVVEARDLRAVVADLRSRRRPHGPVVRAWLWGDRTHFWWSDPLPAFNGVWRNLERRVLGRDRRERASTRDRRGQ
jgi:predicted ATP-grasp superfamily ATP-dependent carboligase